MGEPSEGRIGRDQEGSRRRMVERLRKAGIRDPRVLDAMRSVARHRLVPEALRHRAYDESALPIGERQTISAPAGGGRDVTGPGVAGRRDGAEIGTGSAYQAAILSRLAERVISVERIPRLANRARSALDALGVTNVRGVSGRRVTGMALPSPPTTPSW